MAEGIRTESGERVWIVKREDSVGQEAYSFLRPAQDDDVQGHPWSRRPISLEGEDTEGQLRGRAISPEPLDAEQGLYLAVTDSDEDVTGQRLKRLETEDTEGQRRQMREAEDAEGQVYRRRGPGGEEGKGSV